MQTPFCNKYILGLLNRQNNISLLFSPLPLSRVTLIEKSRELLGTP
jgi:hypothetical protein